MKINAKTICLVLSGICVLFFLCTFFIDELGEAAWHNLGVVVAPPILALFFAILGVALGKQEQRQNTTSFETKDDVSQKLKQAKELLDSGVISQEQYQAFVDNIINGLK